MYPARWKTGPGESLRLTPRFARSGLRESGCSSKLKLRASSPGDSLRFLLRVFLWIVVVLFLACGALAWWYVYRPLPEIEGTAALPGLQQEATVDRDEWGVPHIRATSLNDLLEAQGYVMAQDRLWQMDLLRRVASGQLSEIFGPAALQRDRQYRTLGLRRAAERHAASVGLQSREGLEADARRGNPF